MKILIISADRTTSSGHPQNIGDAFLTDALSASLRRSGYEVVIADFGVADRVGSTETRMRVGGIRGLAGVIRGADAVLVGGGTLLQDDQPDRPFAGLPRLCLTAAVLARALGKKFVVFGVGVDPVRRRRARSAISLTLRLARVWVRDSASQARAAALMSRHPEVSGDVSLFDYSPREPGTALERPGTGALLALNRREAASLTIEQIGALRTRWGAVQFVSMDQGEDWDGRSLSAPVSALLGADDEGHSWQTVRSTISQADVVIASRMHALYMGVLSAVPVVAISGFAKVDAFASDFHVETAATIGEATERTGRVDTAAVEAAVAALEAAKSGLMTYLGGAR
ncbi:polysaccharide pyruvyl transferase family protein [Subtercola sp. Z020]|uniref:polysaccharide pyruvyl transferase family protein n=1 Tax=Subtercola sp. Z020 TaxID=2080582 RepID=UPI000CE7E80A|nr:polysaccharide pyruvyl transferase family protein [Subtercola sp. Z020]PPF81332.1 polysaccharide pyruvyl transferase family protein [Subtercola sp. Z020]